MPLHPCEAGHDYCEPFTQRIKTGKVTVIKHLKECLGCGRQVEVITRQPDLPVNRIKTYT